MMAFKRPLSESPAPQQTNNNTIETQQDDPSNLDVCRICADKARFINYGAFSCQSCKTFFRRNGFRPESVRPCRADNRCEINIQTRQNCTACRLAKCLQMGMSSDLIRKEDRKKAKHSPSIKSDNTEQNISNKSTTILQSPTVDRFRGDQSLIESEWTLLSNIIHAHDRYSTISQVCQNINSLSTLPAEMHINLINPTEIISQIYTSMQSFITSSPDFRILTLKEQTSLFKRNLYGVIGFYAILFFRDTNILHHNKYMEAFTTIYGSEIMLLAKNVNERLDPDSTIIKLTLIIFAFSSNCLIIDKCDNTKGDSLLYGTFRLLGSQNVYVELLWKYMVYKYGYNESALRFSRLIQIFLCVLKNLAIIHMNNQGHQNMIDDIIEKTQQSLTINDIEQSPLWGKT